jgi:tetratricopeptide (TPR) repeat protein
MKLQYVDSEGDKCTISSEPEWLEMRQELSGQTVFRIWVLEGRNYFKDGPETKLVKAYSNDHQEPEPTVGEEIKDSVTRALSNLFPGGKILPYNLPAFLEQTVRLITRDDSCVDIDVDLAQLAHALHQRAYSLLNSSSTTDQLQEAKTCLTSLLNLNPTNSIANYNLACAESLLGNISSALSALKTSIENGYRDAVHMSTDPDLESLHGQPEFIALVQMAQHSGREEATLPVSVVEHKEAPVAEPEQCLPEEQEPQDSSMEVIPEGKWSSQIQLLAEMGFLDQSVLLPALDKTSGNIDEALMDLLG